MDKYVRPVFTLDLNYKITPGLVTIGKYDGTHPCLTAAVTADKVIIHSPHRRFAMVTGKMIWSESNKEIATLNINQPITALIAGLFIPNNDKEMLIIGTANHILAYNVHDNKDIFYKECQDGVKAIVLGNFKDKTVPILLVGGNSSIHAYDYTGNEVFWTAVGDVVTSLALLDYNNDGLNELIVSSEDYYIRVYKGDQIIAEHAETEVVTGLTALLENRFAYSVSNGTVGVYEQDVRLWRVKSKNFAVTMYCYDLLGLGPSTQLITGWSNGKIDCRSMKTGEVLFKDTLSNSMAGIVEGDYRSIGKTDLICVSTDGEVRGFTTTKSLTTSTGSVMEQDTVRDLLSQKQALLMELKHYDSNTKYNENVTRSTENNESLGVIPANTRLQIGISTNNSTHLKPHVEIYVSTNNNTIIKAVVVFAEGIFKGETLVVHPPASKLSSELAVPLYPPKDSVIDIHIKALVGYPNSVQFHVFEITRQLPKFSMYSLIENEQRKSQSYVEFKINERLQRICIWINQNFLLPNDIEYDAGTEINLHLKCLRDNTDLQLIFRTTGKTTFYTENMTLAADLIQSLAMFLNLETLESKASFVKDEEELKAVVEKLNEIQEARLRLSTDIADKLTQIGGLVIRAEDSRLNDLQQLPQYYTELNLLNKDLINGYNIRLANYNAGVEAMKKINSVIQRASRLRIGQKSANMINHCRNAIKDNNIEGLIKIIQTGEV